MISSFFVKVAPTYWLTKNLKDAILVMIFFKLKNRNLLI